MRTRLSFTTRCRSSSWTRIPRKLKPQVTGLRIEFINFITCTSTTMSVNTMKFSLRKCELVKYKKLLNFPTMGAQLTTVIIHMPLYSSLSSLFIFGSSHLFSILTELNLPLITTRWTKALYTLVDIGYIDHTMLYKSLKDQIFKIFYHEISLTTRSNILGFLLTKLCHIKVIVVSLLPSKIFHIYLSPFLEVNTS